MNSLSKYRPDIDGLRGMSVLSVVLYHAFPTLMNNGFIGVDIFFVISGYLITLILSQEMQTSRFSLLHFYSRRIKRIFPVLILTIFSVFILGWIILSPTELKKLGQHIIAGAGFFSNYVYLKESGYFDKSATFKPLWHLWSLAIEEQFYILWPFFVVILWKFKQKKIIILQLILASFFLCLFYQGQDPSNAFYSTFSRVWEILTGAILATLNISLSKNKKDIFSIAGTIYLLVGFILIIDIDFFPGWLALFPTIGTALLIAAGPNALINKYFFSNRILIWFGLISYPLYLFHWPLLVFYKILYSPAKTESSLVWVLLFSIFISYIAFKYIERPIRYNSNKYMIGILIVLMSIVGFTGYLTKSSDGFPSRVPENIKNLLAESGRIEIGFWNEGSCYLNPSQVASAFNQCPIQGNLKAQDKILIWGDSHAAHLFAAYVKRFGTHYQIILRAQSACPPFLHSKKKNRPHCEQNNENIFEFIKRERPFKIVLASNWTIHQWHLVGKTIEELHKEGFHNIDLIGPTPQWINTLPQQLYLNFKSGHSLYLAQRLQNGLVQEVLQADKPISDYANKLGIRYISPIQILCNPQGCLTTANNSKSSLINFDHSHLTSAGSDFLVSHFPEL